MLEPERFRYAKFAATLVALVSVGSECARADKGTPVAPEPTSASASEPARTPSGAELGPTPLISRGKRVVGSSSFHPPAAVVVDGQYRTYAGTWSAGTPTASSKPWVAIEIGPGPTRLILAWSASGSYNYDETDYGSPGSYRIETSSDSTNGSNGAWDTVVTAERVKTHAAEHLFAFAGKKWLRFTVTSAPAASPNGVQIDEIDVHDASAGLEDTWFFMGDSITAFAFDRQTPAHQPSFAELVHAAHADHFPLMINGGIGGDKSDEGAAHVDEWLAGCPDIKHWAIEYGTNDAAGNGTDTAHFERNIRQIVERIEGAGRVAHLAKIPYASDGQHGSVPAFNAKLDELGGGAPRGPDLYTWFSEHPGELRDGIHPTDAGIRSINRLWAEAMQPLYTGAR
jgi:acyl-CoA thioesterase-1